MIKFSRIIFPSFSTNWGFLYVWGILISCTFFLFEIEDSFAKNHALLISVSQNSNIKNENLKSDFLESDLQSLTNSLQSGGYIVEHFRNSDAKRNLIINKLVHYSTKINKNDSLIVFFSGVGVRSNKNDISYLLTEDVKTNGSDGFALGGIRIDHLFDYLNDIPSEKKLLILDLNFEQQINQQDITFVHSIDPQAWDAEFLGSAAKKNLKTLSVLASFCNSPCKTSDLRHGRFNQALIDAVSLGNQKTSGHSSLKLKKMFSLVKTKISKFKAKEPFEKTMGPEVFSFVNESTSDWEIFRESFDNKLIFEPTALKEYIRTIKKWEKRGWISTKALFISQIGLKRWKQSYVEQVPMNINEEKLVSLVKRILDFDIENYGLTEQAHARALEKNIEEFYPKHNNLPVIEEKPTVVPKPLTVVKPPIDASSSKSPRAKRALLIGIDKYRSGEISQLKGCVNDVELMEKILVSKFNVSSENIKVLKNEQATHAKIVSAIQTHLIAKAKPNEVVILHFSGHGSQMRDADGDEIDHLDETLVPHDSRTPGVFDITDDEINGLLHQLTQKTKNVTVILDSCHSGAAARGGTTVREIAPDDRTPPPPADYARSSRELGEGDANFRLNGSNYVLISGCLSSQRSNESVFNESRYGALTWYLAEALQAAGDDTTYDSMMVEVQKNVSMRFPSQEPQLEGLGTNQIVFGTDKINTQPYLLTEPLSEGKVQIQGGAVYGLKKDSVIEVYSPKTVNFEKSQPLAKIKIFQLEDFSSQAEVVQGQRSIPKGSKALIEAIHFGSTAIPIYIDVQSVPALKTVRQALDKMETLSLSFVKKKSGAQLILQEQHGKVVLQSGDLEFLRPPIPITKSNFENDVITTVKDFVQWLTVLELKNPNPRFSIKLQIQRQKDSPNSRAPQQVISDTSLTYRVLNNSARDLYVYIFDVSSDGCVYLLHPPVKGEHEALPSGAEFEKSTKFYVPQNYQRVVDVIKVIATDRRINPSIFPNGCLRELPPGNTRGLTDPLERLLAQGTHGMRAPRLEEHESMANSWVTAQRSFTLIRPTVNVSGFLGSFSEIQKAEELKSNLFGIGRDSSPPDTPLSCLNLDPSYKDGTIFGFLPCAASRDSVPNLSIGKAFDRAYSIQAQIGAQRVEPNIQVIMPVREFEGATPTRSSGKGDEHDPLAKQDDQWSLKQIQAFQAWEKIRRRYQVLEGSEAEGILIAHPDTGYLPHPEIWDEFNGIRPIDEGKGYNYYEGNANPEDPLLKDRLLDHPGHGTASASVIISPPGCQLPGNSKCVNGVAPGAQVIPLRVHRTVSQFNTGALTKAIQDVADGNIQGNPKLISIAMGGPPTYSMWKAVKAAEDKGVLIIAAAGNYVKTVVWPARFESTIAVAAHNVRCQHWKGSSNGNAVDISAPGESVWRATLSEEHQDIIGMGKGTTFATSHTSGAAALWLVWHQDKPKILEELQANGLITKAFRKILKDSARRPSGNPSENPAGMYCQESAWDENFGPGMLDVNRLLEMPLVIEQEGLSDQTNLRELSELPLFSSLYPPGTKAETIRNDYQTLVGQTRGDDFEKLTSYETEILYHYTVNEEVRRAIDGIVQTQRGIEPYMRARTTLQKQDLSIQLREILSLLIHP